MNAPLRRIEAISPATELLLLTHSVIRNLHGARKETLMRAWTRAALAETRDAIGEERVLPENPRAALLALHEAVLELGEALGIERIEFMDSFNARADSGRQSIPENATSVTERCVALLALFCARRMEQSL